MMHSSLVMPTTAVPYSRSADGQYPAISQHTCLDTKWLIADSANACPPTFSLSFWLNTLKIISFHQFQIFTSQARAALRSHTQK